MPKMVESLPELYRDLLPEIFSSDVPEETKATCSNCAMCDPASETKFRPDTKCCTYYPSLPNYLVGAILLSQGADHEAGKEKILKRIENRNSVTPYGVAALAKYNFLYQNAKEFFGRSKEMRCPYYDEAGGGLCSIWKYREAVCSTYFCKHVGGADGRRYWMSIKSYLTLVEQQLSRYAIYQLYPEYLLDKKHPTEPPNRPLTAEDLADQAPKESVYRGVWSNWTGMEKEFFEECYKIVSSLKRADLEKIMGLDGDVAEAAVKRSLQQWQNPSLPLALKLNPQLKVQRLPGGEVLMTAYSELDSLAVSDGAYDMLLEFDGQKPVSDVRALLRTRKQSDFADEVLLSLYQHRVLIDP